MKSVGFNDTVTPSGAKDVKDTANLNTVASEKHATGTNAQKAHVVKHPSFGKLGGRGKPQ